MEKNKNGCVRTARAEIFKISYDSVLSGILLETNGSLMVLCTLHLNDHLRCCRNEFDIAFRAASAACEPLALCTCRCHNTISYLSTKDSCPCEISHYGKILDGHLSQIFLSYLVV